MHEAEEGGYWAEVPAIFGCATAHDTWEELLQNLRAVAQGCFSVILAPIKPKDLL